MEQRRRRNSKRRRKKQMQRIMLCMGIFFVALIAILGGTYLFLNRYVSKYPEDKIAENIYVGPIDAAGMTKKQLKNAMEKHLETKNTTKVTLLIDENKEEVTLESLGFGYKNIDKVVNQAFSYGKEGSVWDRYHALKDISKEKLVFEEGYSVDDKAAKAVLKEKAVPLANHAVNATITKYSGGFNITEEREGKTVNIKKTIASLEEFLNKKWDYKDFRHEVILKKETPKIKATELETIQDELGSFSTDAGGGTRWQNLKTGIGKVNGLVVMPGEEISVHDVTAPYDAEHGYVAAGSYENGQVVETYGGGICQVSSTLYNALLRAEVEIVKRYPHSMLVAYVEPSMDAAIAGDVKDLVFKNNYDTPIYIEGKIDGSNQLAVTIYGKEVRDKNREVKYESEIISTTEYETVYKENSESAIGSMEGGGSPHTGKEARLWKIIFENGKEISREDINYSKYNKSDYIVSVGTRSDVAAASSLVRNAIATQDVEKIKQAINEAKALEQEAKNEEAAELQEET